MKNTNKYGFYSVLKQLFGYIKPYKRLFWITAFLTVFAAFISPIRPAYIQKTIDIYIFSKDEVGMNQMIIWLILILLAEVLVQFSQTYTANLLGQSIIKDIRIHLFKKLIHYKLQFFDKTPIGTLVTRVVSDIETIADVFSQGILMIIGDLLKIIVVLIVMINIDWSLTLISLTTLPVLIISANLFKNAVKKSFQEVRNQVAALNTFVQEHITGITIVQAFNREEEEMERFKQINQKHKEANIKSIWAYSIFFPVVEVLSAISLALLVWWGAKGVISENISFGILVQFILYIHMLFRPIRQIADNFNVLQMGMVSSERVFRLINEDQSIIHTGTEKLPQVNGELLFKNVWFAYQHDDWILKDFTLQVSAGESLAVVGATGAGKTSIINILSRFYEYQQGDIYLDKINIKNLDISDYRKCFAVVTQDVFLFSDTIYNNITLGDPSITLQEVIESAKEIGVHDYIQKLPQQYHHPVQERGNSLSVGQRQLISFLRAYVQKPKILILDEATSSVDNESELLIQHAIEKITKNRTSIIIAHRLSTIHNCDKIIVLEKGKIIESGTHQELINMTGHYRKLYELQFI